MNRFERLKHKQVDSTFGASFGTMIHGMFFVVVIGMCECVV